MMTIGFSTVCCLLLLSFYRKYQDRLRDGSSTAQYARLADYYGLPIAMAFRYHSEDGADWIEVEVDVDEIYHYGPDYFLRGDARPDGRRQIYKWSRVSDLRLGADADGVSSVEALLAAAGEKGFVMRRLELSIPTNAG